MDKNSIKKYAVWARRELISRVSQKALQYGVSEKESIDAAADTVNGHLLSGNEKKQRQALINRIKQIGYQQTMEEAAYTWFNRFSALRFMEVNGYLPTHVRVFTDEQNAFKPQILAEAIHMELDGHNMDKVYELKDANKTDELYKYLLITQCNALSAVLPGMFTRIEDYTELLFPDNLLREGSVIEQMISMIPEEDWKDAVQIIGWLYQYYNAEPKDKVFADLKKNIKISKENIPAATQLFTPDWIVRYMVENSLGRLWVEGHPNEELKANWKYYLEEAEQEPDVQAQLAEIRKEYAAIRPEDIKVIDPCMGSGHILVYLFEVLIQIYESYGYNTRDAAGLILKNNLYGLDIDDRAAQLAYFAVMMKARQYDRRIFSRGIQPHVYSIVESNGLDSSSVEYFTNSDPKLKKNFGTLVDELRDAKEYGSILNISQVDFAALYARVEEVRADISMFRGIVLNSILPLIQVAEVLAQKYDVVVTNPPYMGGRSYSSKMSNKIQELYPDGKQDLFAVFIQRCTDFANTNKYVALITMHSFMFLASFEQLRYGFLSNNLISLVHLGIKAFDEIGNDVVQTASYVFRRRQLSTYRTTFCRLVDSKDQQLKETDFLAKKHFSTSCVADFLRIPGATLAYWVSNTFIENYEKYPALGGMIEMSSLNKTGNNEKFLRFWWEVAQLKIGDRWVFYSKGGNFRRYYGNIDAVVDWSESARWFYKNNKTSNLVSEEYWFKEGITYSAVTSRGTGFRYLPAGCVYDMGGPAIFVNSSDRLIAILALLNSSVASYYFNAMNPSINLQTKDIKQLPVILDSSGQVEKLASMNLMLAKKDWNCAETSFDFTTISLGKTVLSKEYEQRVESAASDSKQFMENLAQINERYAEIYHISSCELPQLEERDNAIKIPNRYEWIESIISYAVGCMFGRYSLDADGLAYAGGEWNTSKYKTIVPDSDNIIPICDDEYFDDDITGRFVKWVEAVYGKDTLEENLKFIADALGGKGTPRDVIRSYFLNDFYSDHCKTYQKRPIYWLFDSGKKNGFKALIYMHRYKPDIIARMRTDYVHEQQSRYRTAIADLEQRVNSSSTGERVKLSKQLQKLQDQANEIRSYEEKIHHLADMMIPIDLDDGVKVNYAKFEDVLARIK